MGNCCSSPELERTEPYTHCSEAGFQRQVHEKVPHLLTPNRLDNWGNIRHGSLGQQPTLKSSILAAKRLIDLSRLVIKGGCRERRPCVFYLALAFHPFAPLMPGLGLEDSREKSFRGHAPFDPWSSCSNQCPLNIYLRDKARSMECLLWLIGNRCNKSARPELVKMALQDGLLRAKAIQGDQARDLEVDHVIRAINGFTETWCSSFPKQEPNFYPRSGRTPGPTRFHKVDVTTHANPIYDHPSPMNRLPSQNEVYKSFLRPPAEHFVAIIASASTQGVAKQMETCFGLGKVIQHNDGALVWEFEWPPGHFPSLEDGDQP